MTPLPGPLRRALGRLAGVAPPSTWAIAVVAVAVAALNLALALDPGIRWASILVVIALLCLMLALAARGAEITPRRTTPLTPATDRWADHAEWRLESAATDEEYEEDVDLTVWIGETPERDSVLERRSTRPHHAISGRRLTLISPYADSEVRATPFEPDLKVAGGAVGAHWQQSAVAGRGAVLFDTPVAIAPLRWEVSYRIPGGLWNPLRAIGLDVFRYDVRQFPIGRFTVRFVVHPGAEDVFVQERSRRGSVAVLGNDPDGNHVRLWTSDSPTARVKYEWDIRVVWKPSFVRDGEEIV